MDFNSKCGSCGDAASPLLKLDGSMGSATGDISATTTNHGLVFSLPLNEQRTFWIRCHGCHKWFHGRCVKVAEYEDDLLEKFHCDTCVSLHGPSTWLQTVAPHRFIFHDDSQIGLPVEIGTKVWIEAFSVDESKIPPPPEEHVVIYEDGTDFMNAFNRNEDWTKICLVRNKTGLGLQLPSGDFSTEDLVNMFGENHLIDTVDVYRQTTQSMTLGTFHRLISSKSRDRIYNFLNLNLSNMEKLREIVTFPDLLSQLSFVHKFWPKNADDSNVAEAVKNLRRPDVDLSCLCTMGGSYTDFHIDFGGSSVWFHVYKGQKIFYVVPPTEENLAVYERHQTIDEGTETFLGDLLPPGQLYRVVINEGETMWMPSGWIHAVLTPVDTMGFSGNFLHHLSIPKQLRINDIEETTGTGYNFTFPYFETIHWCAADKILLPSLKESNAFGMQVIAPIFDGTKALLPQLAKWLELDGKSVRGKSPDARLFRNLRDEFKKQERMRAVKKRSTKRERRVDSDDEATKNVSTGSSCKAKDVI